MIYKQIKAVIVSSREINLLRRNSYFIFVLLETADSAFIESIHEN